MNDVHDNGLGTWPVEIKRSAACMFNWKPYLPSDVLPWNVRRVVHLHRRAGFGATWREIQRDLQAGPDESVKRLLRGAARSNGEGFNHLADVIGTSAVGSNNPNRLKAWWFYRLLYTPDPLGEKLTLMWHNHFATSNLKVGDLSVMQRQNALFRGQARSDFQNLLEAVTHDPAVLIYLDANSNREGQPNENLSRELMELFTLGIGNYTERDVKEAARALSGWTVRDGKFHDNLDVADVETKEILGHAGKHRGKELLKILCSHHATSRRIAWRLCEVFMGEEIVDDEALDELATGLRENDLNIGWAVQTILRSRLFFADENIASRVSSPVEFTVGAIRALQVLSPAPQTLLLAEWAARMGQDLFYPPNVGGWSGGKDWLAGQYVVCRANFATAMLQGRLTATGEPPNLGALCEQLGCDYDVGSFVRALSPVLCGVNPDDQRTSRLVDLVRDSQFGKADRLRLAASLMLALPIAQFT